MKLDDLSSIPCNNCGTVGQLEVFTKLEAREIGTYSLAGTSSLISATEWPWMRCNFCKKECRGKR